MANLPSVLGWAACSPVKTTANLLALRSDAYEVTEEWRLVLSAGCRGVPPTIELDAEHYKLVDQLEAALAGAVPSLAQCRELTVRGLVFFNARNMFIGKVSLLGLRSLIHPPLTRRCKQRAAMTTRRRRKT